ncbi:hypothetical protein DSP73_21175 [Salmonella enterica]|nr:hypothetical protein [Salmonella enterica]
MTGDEVREGYWRLPQRDNTGIYDWCARWMMTPALIPQLICGFIGYFLAIIKHLKQIVTID